MTADISTCPISCLHYSYRLNAHFHRSFKRFTLEGNETNLDKKWHFEDVEFLRVCCLISCWKTKKEIPFTSASGISSLLAIPFVTVTNRCEPGGNRTNFDLIYLSWIYRLTCFVLLWRLAVTSWPPLSKYFSIPSAARYANAPTVPVGL